MAKYALAYAALRVQGSGEPMLLIGLPKSSQGGPIDA